MLEQFVAACCGVMVGIVIGLSASHTGQDISKSYDKGYATAMCINAGGTELSPEGKCVKTEPVIVIGK